MPQKYDLTNKWVKIPVGRAKTLVLQNISDIPLQWTPDKKATNAYYLRAGEFLKVNYDVWVKSDSHGVSHLVAGTLPRGYLYTYRDVVPNKTYVQNKSDAADLTTTFAVIHEFPELTIQKDKNIKVSIRVPVITSASAGGAVDLQVGVKLNGVETILFDTDRVLCNSTYGDIGMAYTRTFVMDLIGENLVSRPEADYKIQLKLSGKTQSSTCRIGNAGVNNEGASNTSNIGIATLGTLLPSARNQNYISIITEEMDR